jgi:hypothetical protein
MDMKHTPQAKCERFHSESRDGKTRFLCTIRDPNTREEFTSSARAHSPEGAQEILKNYGYEIIN